MKEKVRATKFIKSFFNKLVDYKKQLLLSLKESKEKLKNIIETNYKLGLYHLNANNLNDASFRFRLVLYFEPTHYNALYNLAKCLIAKKKTTSAVEKLKLALKLKTDFTEAQYLLSTIDRSYAIETVPLSIIRDYYDKIADQFNDKFSIQKGYKVPMHMSNLLCANIEKKDKAFSVLDVGCGTGKCGEEIYQKLKVSNMIGVDISSKMLEKAHELKKDNAYIFNKLVNIDYFKFLKETNLKYDIILAGLSLHFNKNLSPILSLLKFTLSQKGYIVFAIEKSDNVDIKFNSSYENFCYNENYIKESVSSANLHLLSLDEILINNKKSILIAICTN